MENIDRGKGFRLIGFATTWFVALVGLLADIPDILDLDSQSKVYVKLFFQAFLLFSILFTIYILAKVPFEDMARVKRIRRQLVQFMLNHSPNVDEISLLVGCKQIRDLEFNVMATEKLERFQNSNNRGIRLEIGRGTKDGLIAGMQLRIYYRDRDLLLQDVVITGARNQDQIQAICVLMRSKLHISFPVANNFVFPQNEFDRRDFDLRLVNPEPTSETNRLFSEIIFNLDRPWFPAEIFREFTNN